MNLRIQIVVVMLATLSVCFGEAPQVEIKKIKEIFQKTNAQIAALEKSPEAAKSSPVSVDHYITNALNRRWEGVGNYKVMYRYYYLHDAPNDENHLLKISRTSESAARRYHEEFYYDEAGKLVFYFQKTNDGDYPKERRIYFQNGKAIRLIDDKFSRDGYTDGDQEMVNAMRKREKAILLKFTSR